jgi:peptidoglycan/xylan/chitin deacetylase (PgdA/CDA1 family)
MVAKGLSISLGILLSLMCLPAHAHSIKHTCSTIPAKGTVALTFDDGPSPVFTRKVLDILTRIFHH